MVTKTTLYSIQSSACFVSQSLGLEVAIVAGVVREDRRDGEACSTNEGHCPARAFAGDSGFDSAASYYPPIENSESKARPRPLARRPTEPANHRVSGASLRHSPTGAAMADPGDCKPATAAVHYVLVDHGPAHVLVAEQFLHGPDVVSLTAATAGGRIHHRQLHPNPTARGWTNRRSVASRSTAGGENDLCRFVQTD
jgi:hypothetical protein